MSWPTLHYCSAQTSPSIIRLKNEMRGVCTTCGREESSTQYSRGETRGKRQFGRPRRRQEDDITVYLQEVGYGENDWIYLIDSDRC